MDISSARLRSRFDITAADASLFVGSLDALAAALLLLLALWYERVALPLAVKREARTFVTPDAYTIFVSGLPRRLSEEKHVHYEELLRAHFERQMSSELLGEELLRGLKGWRVVAEKERHRDEPPKASCCGARGLDKRGRRLGVLTDVREEGCLVRWPDATGRLLPPELCSGGLLQADLLARLEDVGCEASAERREAVYNVSLIRDFKGKLRGMRRVVERAKKIDEEGKGTVEEEKELLEAEEELRDLNLEEKDVLGAFVTFNYIKFKDFVSQEYRFSQLFLLGSFLQGEDQRFEGNALKIDEAPLPSDIFWENFDCPKSRRRLKTLLVGLTFLTLLVVMVLGLSLAKWGREAAQSQSPDCSLYVNVTGQEDQPLHCYCGQQGLANVLQDRPTGLRSLCQGYLQSFALVQGMIVGAAVFSAVINVASGQLIARLAHFMQPPNWTALEATIMEMTFLVQLLTLGVVVTLVNADFQFGLGAPKGILGLIGAGEFQDIDRAWTAAVGVEILTLFIFSLSSEAVSALGVLYFKLSCWLLGRRQQSWKEMKALYTPPDFELALHQASQLSATCAALMYASCLPLLYLLLALRLFLMYWSAKFELLRGSQVPKRFSHVLAMASCRWVQVAVFAHCSVAIWVYGDATLTGTTHLVWDSEATSYMAQLRRVLGDQLSVVMEIVVEKAMTPAAMGNALILAFLCFMWAMKLVSFLVGDAEWQQLKSTVLKVFPKALRTPQRRGVFEQSFEKEPMQEMLRMKINPSYELWRSSGFEFLRPGQAGSIQEMLAEAKRRREEDAKNLLAKRDEEDRAAQHFLPIQIIGQATDTE